MTDDSFSVRLYWGARAESPRVLAERFSTTMRELGECHPLLERWNEQAMSYREALRLVVEPTPEAIEPLFTTIEPARPTLFGHELTLWNGRSMTEQRCELRVKGGKVPTILGDNGNLLLLYPPSDPAEAPTLYSAAGLAQVLTVLVRIWQPDSAVVMHYEYEARHVLPDGELPTPGKPRVGWLTYLRRARLTGLPEHLPEAVPCKTVDVDELGTIFIVADDHTFASDNPEDVAHALALTAFLEEHGALAMIPTSVPM